MKHSELRGLFTAFLLVFIFVSGCVAANNSPYGIKHLSTFYRTESAEFKEKGISGISHKEGDRYIVVNDSDGSIYEFEITMNENGKITNCKTISKTKLQDAVDLEGIAYDKANKTIWASDEWHQTIKGYGLDGKLLKDVPVPPIFKETRYLMGFESLTISENGLEMYSANEEALLADGANSSNTNGSLVRIIKYARPSTEGEWTVAAHYPYLTDTIAGANFRNVARSGVSDLCALDDGRLIVLEREMSRERLMPRFRTRLYLVDPGTAKDVKDIAALKEAEVSPVSKVLIYETYGLSMYEGICIAKHCDDGSYLLLMIADSGNGGRSGIISLRLSDATRRNEE